MKTFIPVIFFVTYIVAQASTGQSKCPGAPPPMSGLNLNDFFKNHWFLTKADSSSKDPVCRDYVAFYLSGIVKFRTAGKYRTENGVKMYNATCTGTNGPRQNPLKLDCMYYTMGGQSDQTVFSKLVLTVINTDYNSYALVYRCNTFKNKVTEGDKVLLLRQRNGASPAGSSGLLPCQNL